MKLSYLALALSLSACSSSESPSTGTTDAGASSNADAGATGLDAGGADVPTNDAKLVLAIPATLTGAPRELDVIVTPSVPVAGPPANVLYQSATPSVTAGHSLTLHGDATGVRGTYYVVVVLYMKGGGTFAPMPGVDYQAQTASPITFDGGPVDLGALSLGLVTDGGT